MAGCFSWADKDFIVTAALLVFYEGLLKILALGFLSVSMLRSNKEVAKLLNREALMKDI